MPRYAALLRGVSPINLKMADLKRCLEESGMINVATVLSSGNVVFDSNGSESQLEKKIESAIQKKMGKYFLAIVVSLEDLSILVSSNPFETFKLKAQSKRVITFCKEKPKISSKLPIVKDGASILKTRDKQVFTAYVPNEKGPVFMSLLEKNFGKNITTRTFETVEKIVRR
jgi:uncharacterized protein (DUF1697 family)